MSVSAYSALLHYKSTPMQFFILLSSNRSTTCNIKMSEKMKQLTGRIWNVLDSRLTPTPCNTDCSLTWQAEKKRREHINSKNQQ